MKLVLNSILLALLVLSVWQNTPAQNGIPPAGIATMFALDPLTQSFCFKDGGPGGSIQKGKVFNRCSDLNFNGYSADGFSVGVEGGRQGVILDLGTPQDLKLAHGYTETVGNGQGFASLNVKSGKVMIVKDYREGTRQELKNSAKLFETPKSSASSAVKLGHIYLIRITDRNDPSYEMLAKIMVIAHVPSESVTIRWYVLSNSEVAQL